MAERMAVVETQVKQIVGSLNELREETRRAHDDAEKEREAMRKDIAALMTLVLKFRVMIWTLTVVGSVVGSLVGGIVTTALFIGKIKGWIP